MITFLSFIFVLSFLVFVHELGHFTVAKLSGIGVERFSIGLPPRLFGVRIGETEYCISMIPFGGYVKMIGQDDFSYDESEDDVIGPKDYRGKSPIIKIAVLVAGSLMNLVTAVVIFSLLFMSEGVPEQNRIIGFVTQGTFADEIGLKTGDEIVAVDGEEIESIDQAFMPLYTEKNVTLSVHSREGNRTVTTSRQLKESEDLGILPYYEARIDRTVEGSPAEKAGFKPDDVITAIDGTPLDGGWIQMTNIIENNAGNNLVFSVKRDGSTVDLPVTVGIEKEQQADGSEKTVGKVGLAIRFTTKKVGVGESVVLAFDRTADLAGQTLSFFGKLITGRMSPKLMGGPVMIAQIAGESAKSGISTLLGFTAFISINLGVLNLLPFPVLDGGNIAILVIEAVTRKKISVKIRMTIQQVGSIALLLLMIYITFNDILRFDTISRLFGG